VFQKPNSKKQNIYLVGFMASGKTTIGRLLAKGLSLPFVDSDDLIALGTQSSIPDIFSELGEEGFRALESRALLDLARLQNVVVATGGGAVLSGENRDLLSKTGFVIWLDVPLEEAICRSNDTVSPPHPRPLLGKARDLYEMRIPLYSSVADLKIDTAGKSPIVVLGEILDTLFRKEAIASCETLTSGQPLASRQSLIASKNRVTAQEAGDGSDLEPLIVSVTPESGMTHPYEVIIGPGVLERADRFPDGLLQESSSESGKPEPARPPEAVLFSDPTVYCLFGKPLVERLASCGISVLLFLFPGNEETKNLKTVEKAYDFLAKNGVSRNTPLMALGGGVVGDLAGFVASTYMRGIPFIQFPTTLLAQIDASVGGKVAVDHHMAKNLIGAFYHPKVCLVDTNALSTLPPTEFRQGLAEMVKYAIIDGEDMMRLLETSRDAILRRDASILAHLVQKCVTIKAQIVQRDERDRGVRQFLNLGHTLGHAIESSGGYGREHGGPKHGDAVAIGLLWACKVAERISLADSGLADRVKSLIEQLGLPIRLYSREPGSGLLDQESHESCLWVSRDRILAAMKLDKKAQSGRIRLVLPRRPGSVELRNLDEVPENIFNEELNDALGI
jgi:shikimate kinase/3-dehydroquinate synthase